MSPKGVDLSKDRKCTLSLLAHRWGPREAVGVCMREHSGPKGHDGSAIDKEVMVMKESFGELSVRVNTRSTRLKRAGAFCTKVGNYTQTS